MKYHGQLDDGQQSVKQTESDQVPGHDQAGKNSQRSQKNGVEAMRLFIMIHIFKRVEAHQTPKNCDKSKEKTAQAVHGQLNLDSFSQLEENQGRTGKAESGVQHGCQGKQQSAGNPELQEKLPSSKDRRKPNGQAGKERKQDGNQQKQCEKNKKLPFSGKYA